MTKRFTREHNTVPLSLLHQALRTSFLALHRPLPDFFSTIEIALMAGANIQESTRVAYDALTLGWAVKVPGAHDDHAVICITLHYHQLCQYLFLFVFYRRHCNSFLIAPHFCFSRKCQRATAAAIIIILSFPASDSHLLVIRC
jgi:hypothetical protein